MINFEIVGVFDAQSNQGKDDNSFIAQLSKSIHANTLTSTDQILIPVNLYSKTDDKLKPKHLPERYGDTTNMGSVFVDSPDFRYLIIEFANENSMKAFAKTYTCQQNNQIGSYDTSQKCDKSYYSTLYGMNSIAINEAVHNLRRAILLAIVAISVIALLIIWFTISRIIGSSRHETAIYRAMGAKRRDIVAIYLLYSFGLALRILLVAVIVGLVASFAINYLYSAAATSWMAQLFNLTDTKLVANLFQSDPASLIIIAIMTISASLIASIQPIITNALRPPIRDIREE